MKRRVHEHDDFDALTLGRLSVSDAPDLTRPIMGRLGYMRVPPRVARRRRIVLWAGRCGCIAVAGVAVALGVKAFQASPDARRPAEVTMPAAIHHDFKQQQSRFGSMLRLIQQVPPTGFDADDFDPVHRDPPAYDNGDPYEWHEIDEELNRSAIAPVRWV